MSKKSILSTLLISSALLGTISASAATSAVRPEKKLVSVEKSNAKIYKNSKLQESKTVKKGTVYKVDGYRNINSKKYYRVYQEDTKGKVVYKGYILDKDTKVLKGQKPAKKDRLVALTKDDQTAWKSLYFNKKIKTYDGTKHSSNFEVKYSYNIGGKKYFSLYRGEKWMGYMDGSAFKVLTPKTISEDKQDYKVVKDYDTYSDIYFTENGQLKVGEKVKVKRVYTFGTGRQYGSVYDKDGKWLGYANMSALEAVETSTPEEPDTPVKPDKPNPDKPGTGGDTSKPEKPDTKPDNPGDKPTDKPGQGGDNKPGGDQGGSGSGDTGNKPGDGGTGDSGSGSQPGGGDQGGSGSGDTGTGGDQPSNPGTPEQPDNPGTGGGDTGTPEQPKPEKPTNEEIKALKDAVEKAKKVVAAKDKLDGVEPVEHALEKAEKILKDEDKATKDEVVNATKEIEAAIKGITLKPSINSESIKKLHTAIEQLKETQKLGAGNLVNNEQYDKVLKDAEKVLQDAVNGKANKEKIEAETKKVNDFINGLKLNTKDLEAKIDAVKAKGDKVYMTKAQEDEFNKFIEAAKTAAKDNKLSNTEKLKEIDAQLKKAEDFIKGQPTEADVQKLIDATKKEQDTEAKLKGHESEIFQNWNDVKAKDAAADTMLEEIKKDKAPSNNTAEKPYTAEQVKNTAKELMDSMANLEVNHENLEKYDKAAKDAINDLDEAHKEAAQDLLTSFEVAAQNASVKDLDQMAKAAESLNKEIHDDQVQEINDVIKKAQRIEGVTKSKEKGESTPNAKFYESDSYEAMNTALGQAEEAEKKLEGKEVASRSKRSTSGVGATQVANGKEAAEKEKDLKEKIKDLKVKDWKVDENTDGIIKLTKYDGSYQSTATAKKTGEQVIEIPGSLKDKQVVVESTKGDQLFNPKNSGNGAAEIKFEVATDKRKPKTGADFSYAFANNKEIGKVDITDLDTTEATNLGNIFMNDFYLDEIKGSENLVHNKVTTLKSAFAGTNLSTLKTTGWKTSNVTDMQAMFKGSNIKTVEGMENWDTTNVTNMKYMFGGSHITKVDLSGWAMDKVSGENLDAMFFNDKYSPVEKTVGKTDISEVVLPTEHIGKPVDVVRALEAAGQKGQLAKEVTVKAAVKSTTPEKIGTVDTSGNWEGFGDYSKANIITTDSKILNDPVALCSVVMNSEGDTATDKAAKNLAKLLDKVAYPTWVYSTGHKVIKSRDKGNTVLVDSGENDVNNQGINNNASWSSFEKNGSGHYYKAIKLLQDYAQNKTSITADQAKDMMDALIGDFQGMQVITEDLQDLVAQAKARKEDSKDMVSLIKKAEDCIEHPKLDNWKNIVETTKELREALANKK